MKKIYLSLFAFILIGVLAKAQSGKNISFSIGPEFDIPLPTTTANYGAIRDYYKDGIGGIIKAELPLNSTLHFTGSAGYVYYPTNTHYVYSLEYPPVGMSGFPNKQPPSYYFVPVKIGLRYYYDKFWYIAGETGAAIKTNSTTSNSFIYAGQVGAIAPFNSHSGLDINVRYERGFEIVDYPSPMSQISIGIAYKFSLK